MPRANRTTVSLLLLLASASLFGCSHRPGLRSPYQTFYQNRLADTRLPTYQGIASIEDSLSEIFDQPVPKVWDACLGLAAQSRGVLAAADDAGGGHRLLLIVGETLRYRRLQVPDQQAFIDRWLAISVRPITESSTEVRVAFVSPKTTRVASFSADKSSAGFKGDKDLSVSLRTAGVFIMALRKTFFEDEYLAQFGGLSHPIARGTPRNIEATPTERGESVAKQRGNYESATIRREWLVLNVPRLEGLITGVINDFSLAAGHSKKEAEIFIVANGAPNLQIEPNGDLFITTGCLDKIQNIDELAGVLSHELAHLYLHHGSMRAGTFRRAGASRNMIAFTLMLGGAAIDFLSNIPDSASPEDSLFTNKEALIGAAATLGTYYLSSQLGTGIGKGVGDLAMHRFTRKQELEADEYGAELLWAAGYDYRGLLSLLRRQGDSKLFESKIKRRH